MPALGELALIGLVVGVLVGLTGMGGGALLTPILVLGLGVDPVVAVGSDLVVSLLIKPVGAVVHPCCLMSIPPGGLVRCLT